MATGDVVKTYRFRKETLPSKTGGGDTKGDLLAYDTDGYAPATQTIIKATRSTPFKMYVATETVVAVPATQSDLPALAEGAIGISKVSGALSKGQVVGASATAGKVGAWTAPDISAIIAAYCATTIQAQLDKLLYAIGEVLEDAASGDAFVNTIVR
jgi:hypothetical protein